MTIIFDFHDKLVVIHAVFASIAVLGTAPIAILLGRYWRHNPRWLAYHRLFNIFTVLLVVLVFGLGTAAVNSQGLGVQFSGPSRDLHHDLGLSMFLLVLLEGFLGVLVHSMKPSSQAFLGKGFMRWWHIIFGNIVMTLLIVESWVGFGEWNTMQGTGTFTPDGVRYVFIVIAMAEVATYLYPAGRDILFKTLGDDGHGPWKALEGYEKGESVPCVQC